MPSRRQKKFAKRLAAKSHAPDRHLDWRGYLPSTKSFSPPKVPDVWVTSSPIPSAPSAVPAKPTEDRALKEDVFKLQEFGLSRGICLALSFEGLPNVGRVVRALKAGEKIRQIGPARKIEVIRALKKIGVDIT